MGSTGEERKPVPSQILRREKRLPKVLPWSVAEQVVAGESWLVKRGHLKENPLAEIEAAESRDPRRARVRRAQARGGREVECWQPTARG
jgi:hypothetical protein